MGSFLKEFGVTVAVAVSGGADSMALAQREILDSVRRSVQQFKIDAGNERKVYAECIFIGEFSSQDGCFDEYLFRSNINFA